MANIGDLFPEILANNNNQLLNIGSIFQMPLNDSHGITPKYGQSDRNKYFVVIGFTEEGDIIGALIVNKNINKHDLSDELIEHHYPIQVSKYRSVFTKNCFVSCTSIKSLPKDEVIKNAEYKGDLKSDDLILIMEHLSNSELITSKEKKKYNIKKAD